MALPGLGLGGLKGPEGAQNDQKEGKYVPMIRKLCPKTRSIGGVLSRFLDVSSSVRPTIGRSVYWLVMLSQKMRKIIIF